MARASPRFAAAAPASPLRIATLPSTRSAFAASARSPDARLAASAALAPAAAWSKRPASSATCPLTFWMAADTVQSLPQYPAARSSHSTPLAARCSSRSRTERRSAACAMRSEENPSCPRSSRSPRLARASSSLPRRWYTIDRLIAFAAMPSASSTDRARRIASRYCRAAPSRSPFRKYPSARRLASITAASPEAGGLAGGGATQAASGARSSAARRGDVRERIAFSAPRARPRRFEAVHGETAHGLHFDVVPQEPGVSRRADDVLAVAHQLAALAQQARYLPQGLVQRLAVFPRRIADLGRRVLERVQRGAEFRREHRKLLLELGAHPPERTQGRFRLAAHRHDRGVGIVQHLAHLAVGVGELLHDRVSAREGFPEIAVRLVEIDDQLAQVADHRRELRLQIVDQLGDSARGQVLDLVSVDDRLQRLPRLSAWNELDVRRADVALAEEPRTRGLGHARRVVADDRELHFHPAVRDVEVAHGADGKTEQPHRHALVDPERVGRVKIDRGVAHEDPLLVADQNNHADDPEHGREQEKTHLPFDSDEASWPGLLFLHGVLLDRDCGPGLFRARMRSPAARRFRPDTAPDRPRENGSRPLFPWNPGHPAAPLPAPDPVSPALS